jgi:drug/metabolite transporter (DMT)-like permease
VSFLGEHLTWQILAGAFLIVASLAVTNIRARAMATEASADSSG